MLSSCKLKEGRKKKKKERREKGIRAGKLERMDYRYMVVWGCVCMRVLKNRETSFFFALFHPTPPTPPLLRAQCQAGHGPCRLLRHCALRFQSSPRLIPGVWTGISPRRSPGPLPPSPRRGGLGRRSPPRRSGRRGGSPPGPPGLGMRGWGCGAGPAAAAAARASVPACQRSIT